MTDRDLLLRAIAANPAADVPRLMLADWASLQVDMRDHMFSMDLLGKRQSTHNIEMSAGLMFFF